MVTGILVAYRENGEERFSRSENTKGNNNLALLLPFKMVRKARHT
jgi:hypothetical protein